MIQVELMAPTTAAQLPVGDGWAYEPKWDGYRAATMLLDSAQIVSRRGTDLTGVFPELAAAVEEQVPIGTLLDTELVVLRDGRLSFDALQHRMARGAKEAARLAQTEPASMVVFDVLVDQGEDVRRSSWEERRGRLEAMAASWRPPLQTTPYTTDHGTAVEWMASFAAMGIEGIVAKRRSSRYGGPGSWSKTKFRQTLPGVVGGVIGRLDRPEALIVGTVTDDGDLVVLGRTTALSSAQSTEVGALLRPPEGDHPWPAVMGGGHFGGAEVEVTRAEPELRVEVSADPALQAGRRRHPLRLVRVRRD